MVLNESKMSNVGLPPFLTLNLEYSLKKNSRLQFFRVTRCLRTISIFSVMAGRKKDIIWADFIELPPRPNITGIRVKCKICKKELQGIVQRLKKHKITCCNRDSEDECQDNCAIVVSFS